MGIAQTTALTVIASIFLSRRRSGLHGSTAMAAGTGSAQVRGSGRGVFMAPALRPRWADLWVGCPLPCPSLAPEPGQPVAQEQGPGQPAGHPEQRTSTSPTSMGSVLPRAVLGPSALLRAVEGSEESPADGQAYGNPATYLRLGTGAEQGQEGSSGWLRALCVKCSPPSPALPAHHPHLGLLGGPPCRQPPVGDTCRSFHVTPQERGADPHTDAGGGLSPRAQLLPGP